MAADDTISVSNSFVTARVGEYIQFTFDVASFTTISDDYVRVWPDESGAWSDPDDASQILYGMGAFGSTGDWTFEGTPAEEGEFYLCCTVSTSPSFTGTTDVFYFAVKVLPAEETGEEDSSGVTAGCWAIDSDYCLGTLVTEDNTYEFNNAVTGRTAAELVESINTWATTANAPFAALLVNGTVRIIFEDGQTLTGATDCDENDIDLTTVQAASTDAASNEFFGRDEPDQEWLWYTLIKTCGC